MSRGPDARPGDASGWVRLSPETKAYERARASLTTGGHVVRRSDVVVLDRLLADLRA